MMMLQDQKHLTSEVASVAMPMIQLYVEMGLTCDERDNYHTITSVNIRPGNSFLMSTSTTLAKSAHLLSPRWGGGEPQIRASGSSPPLHEPRIR